MSRWSLLTGLLVMAMPLNAQSMRASYDYESDRMCEATLADGTHFEVWNRDLVIDLGGYEQYLHVKVHVYYKPGSGEFLWLNTGLAERVHASEVKDNSKKAAASCEEPYHHILILQDGEWADFWAENGKITVFHSSLKFETRDKAWSYIREHWQDGPDDPVAQAKWVAEILLYQQLGPAFFRPKRLEIDARPYTYDSLNSVKKVGSNWEVAIKGADEPNCATVLLDSNFKMLAVTKISATP